MYVLITPNEDGEPITVIDNIDDVLERPEDYAVEEFLHEWPEGIHGKKDPGYWREGQAILAKLEILKPKIVATEYSL